MGGGTSAQKKYGIKDSPDILFRDLTDWSIVESNGMPDYRYNDRGIQRALADNEAATYEFLVENGVVFEDKIPDNSGGHALGISAPRENHTLRNQVPGPESPSGSGGTNLMRPLEASARKKGVKFLLNYHMDVIFRETPISGRILGIEASYTPTILPGTTTPLKSFRSQGNIEMNAKTVTVKARRSDHDRHRRAHRQRPFPQDARPQSDRGDPIWRCSLFPSGRQRRTGRHGHRSLVLGHGQPDL